MKIFIRSEDYAVNGNPSIIQFKFDPIFKIPRDKKYEIAVVGGSLTNSVPNISPIIGNNLFNFTAPKIDLNTNNIIGVVTSTIILPSGSYDIAGLNEQLNISFRQLEVVYNGLNPGEILSPIVFVANVYLNRVQMILNPGCSVDFTIQGNFANLFGFNNQIYTNPTAAPIGPIILTPKTLITAQNIANVTARSVALYIVCNRVEGGIYVNTSLRSGVLKVVYTGALGYPISLQSTDGQYYYYKINDGTLDTLDIRILDNTFSIADFNGEKVYIELDIREVK